MNKKQWIALGFLFTLFGCIAGFFSYVYGTKAINIQNAMYSFLAWLCIFVAIACWICGILEKEEV